MGRDDERDERAAGGVDPQEAPDREHRAGSGADQHRAEAFWFTGENAHENFPFFIFIILSAVLTVLAFMKNLSLIPVLGLLSCFYLMTELGYTNWIRFLVWLIIGLLIYFTYSYKNSVLGKESVKTIRGLE